MSPGETFGWLQVDLIGEALAERHRDVDPLGVRFTDLRRMVQELAGFREEPGHPVNERILEEIQRHWIEEHRDLKSEDED